MIKTGVLAPCILRGLYRWRWSGRSVTPSACQTIGVYVRSFIGDREGGVIRGNFDNDVSSDHIDSRLRLRSIARLGQVHFDLVRVKTLKTIGRGMTVAVTISG